MTKTLQVCPTDFESDPKSSYARKEHKVNTDSRVFAFADIETIKERVRSKLSRKPPKYHVFEQYWNTGIAQKIAKSQRFENLTLGIIVINAVWIAIDTDHNQALTLIDATWEFRIADILFFGYFAVELLIRFAAFRRKMRSLCDPWFVFDSGLVCLYLFDPFVMTFAAAVTGGGLDLPTSFFFLLRLFRLLRLTRLVKMLRSLPELMIMIKGMVTAAASVSYTLGLLMLVTYIFAIALAQLSIGTSFREQYFQGVALSMYTLFVYGTLLDSLAGFTDAVREESTVCLMLVAVFAIISALTLMNMLVGVLCEIVSAIASTEKESLLTDKVQETCCKVMEEFDSPYSPGKMISCEEMEVLFENMDAQRAFHSAGINIEHLVDVGEDFLHIDGRQGQMTFEAYMNMVLDCRPSKKAALKDVMVLRRRINSRFREFKLEMKGADHKIQALIAKKRAEKAKLLAAADQLLPERENAASDDVATATPMVSPNSQKQDAMVSPNSQKQDAHEAEAGHELMGCVASNEVERN